MTHPSLRLSEKLLLASRLSSEAMALLSELAIAPKMIDYDHRIAELDRSGLIRWKSGEGYSASDLGRDVVARAALGAGRG
jgi:hypothetical protein